MPKNDGDRPLTAIDWGNGLIVDPLTGDLLSREIFFMRYPHYRLADWKDLFPVRVSTELLE